MDKTIKQFNEEQFKIGLNKFKEKHNIQTIRFYFIRDEENKPVITVMIAKDKDGMYHRGIGMCSVLDQPNRAKGRRAAFKHLSIAMDKKTDDIHQLSDRASIVPEYYDPPDAMIYGDTKYRLGQYNVQLTEMENDYINK